MASNLSMQDLQYIDQKASSGCLPARSKASRSTSTP